MGLDIYVFTDATKTETIANDVDMQNDDLIFVSNTAFPNRLGNMEEGWYEAAAQDDFRAGSYSGYSIWRDTLCRTIHGISAEEFWNSDKAESSEPFAELINMADNEGCLGTSVCLKLAEDFDKYYDQLAAAEGADQFWNLDKWRDGLRQAGENNGFLLFC